MLATKLHFFMSIDLKWHTKLDFVYFRVYCVGVDAAFQGGQSKTQQKPSKSLIIQYRILVKVRFKILVIYNIFQIGDNISQIGDK